MITVYYPKNFEKEREYIINIFFQEFLGLSYEMSPYEKEDYQIVLENNSSIIIKDLFFSYQIDDQYLKLENIPTTVSFTVNPFIVEKDIPILFGTDLFEVANDKVICGIDIFASSFFMLTRWEEYVNKERDLHNRFPATASVAYKNGFLDRPIVNEYVEMLWKMLKYLGINQEKEKRDFEFIITHDVDHIAYLKSTLGLVRSLGGDLIKRRSPLLALNNLFYYLQVRSGYKKDPYDTFDWIMDLSEKENIKSRFYFMSGGLTNLENYYQIDEPNSLNIIRKVKERGHIIGFHPSYNAYNDPVQWEKEKTRLEEVLGFNVKEGRQHFLRFESPITWNIWNENEMEMDCTLSYADREGFRCGTCYEFPVFDFLNRRQLSLKEFPLIVMEGSFTTYQIVTPQKMEEKIKLLIEKTKKYNGNFVYLWHNSSFNTSFWSNYQDVYLNTIQETVRSKGSL